MNAKKPVCMFIGPYGQNESDQELRNDLAHIVCRAVSEEYEFVPFTDATRADMISDLFSTLINAEMVVVDMRGYNPNVMYEIGIRHAFNKPTLLLLDEGAPQLPWDIDKNFTERYRVPVRVTEAENLIKKSKKDFAK